MSDDFRAIDDDAEELLDQWNLADDDPFDSSWTSDEPRPRGLARSRTGSTSIAPVAAESVRPLVLDCSAVVQDFAVESVADEAHSTAGGRGRFETGGAVTCVYDPDAEAID